MHSPFEKNSVGEANIYQSWSMKLLAIPVLLAIALIGYVVSHTDAARWIADGMQAELAGTDAAPDGTSSTRLAHH